MKEESIFKPGRYMAFDYGTKRIGIAVTDPLRIIATSLITLHPNAILDYLKKYISLEPVSIFVVGEPLQMNGIPSEITPHVIGFMNQLKKNFPEIPIHKLDERFTSKLASKVLIKLGINKKHRQDKGKIDKISATLILQSFLEQESIQNIRDFKDRKV